MLNIVAKQVATGLTRPVFAAAPPGDTARLFILEQAGRIRILDLASGLLKPSPFLSIDHLSQGNEQGLLGLAFHPKFSANGFFYVNFTDASGTTNIQRYKVSADPDIADAASRATLLTVPQPFANHNGGWLGFGPDTFLYIGLGDGGDGNDPGNRAQNLGELLGKILRIDVDRAPDPHLNYAIPPSNPFVQRKAVRPEIWAYGLRNPWRASFDRLTGDFYIGDVGQDQWEEIDFQAADSHGGENYGWRVMEGNHATGLDPTSGNSFMRPIHEYNHNDGRKAVIGGYVYRGNQIPDLRGTYFFADNAGPVWSLRVQNGAVKEVMDRTERLASGGQLIDQPSSFGEDAAGELYITDLAGAVYQIVPGP